MRYDTFTPIYSGLVGLVVLAAIYDWRYRRIPNWLTIGGLIAGLVLQATLGAGWVEAVTAIGLALAIYVPLWLLRAVGAGDVKLMAAIGAFPGPREWLAIFLITAVLGGIVALIVVLCKRRLGQTLRNVGWILSQGVRLRAPHRDRPELDVADPRAITLPRGVIIAASTLAWLSFSVMLGPH